MAELRLPYTVRDTRGIAAEALILRGGSISPELAHVMALATVDDSALPAIAYGWDMLGPLWESLATDAARRAYLAERHTLQGLRGTSGCVVRALSYLGWTARVQDMQDALRHDGTITARDGYYARNTAPSAWSSWSVAISMGLDVGYSAAEHALVLEVAQHYGPLRSRMEKVTLTMAGIASNTGTPAWTGPTALIHIGVSADGVTWITHPFRRVTPSGKTALIQWSILQSVANGTSIAHIGLINADGSVFSTQAVTPIWKTSDMELIGYWDINWEGLS